MKKKNHSTNQVSKHTGSFFIRLFLLLFTQTILAQTTLVSFGSTWRYKDDGSNLGTTWKESIYNDAAWMQGNGKFGYGTDPLGTIINACGTATQYPTCGNKSITTYFRKSVNIADASIFSSFNLDMLRDDGVVIYINGHEVLRNNIATGTVSSSTRATSASDNGTLIISNPLSIATSYLTSGTNVIAAEVHQSAGTSSDLVWDMRLTGLPRGSTLLTRGPYIQNTTPTSTVLRWRTNDAANSKVFYGTSPDALNSSAEIPTIETDHAVRLTGLEAGRKYYYSIGTTEQTLQRSDDNFFKTNPVIGSTDTYRFWILGDPGLNSANQINVRDRFNASTNRSDINGWLLLGDNAYENGTDAEYKTNFFDVYQESNLLNIPLWSIPGNHEYYVSTSARDELNIAYYDIFDFPVNGEAGGIASHTESYYSFDYGNIHFVALDSYGSKYGAMRLDNTAGEQVKWLEQDLTENKLPWVVAAFHHPPYSAGSHNSDTEADLISIRQNLTPVLEKYGVDLVISGHSHDYERGKLMKGHTGLEATFNPSENNLSNSSGLYNGTTDSCPYIKGESNEGTVYVVAGSGGYVDAASELKPGYPHNALPFAGAVGGSLILEVQENKLNAQFLTASGTVFDRFTMLKNTSKNTTVNIESGKSIELNASWNGDYNWTTGVNSKSILVSPLENTTYAVSDLYQCLTDSFSVNVLNVAVTAADITSVSQTTLCAGTSFTVNFTAAGAVVAPNTYSLELSDASGNFSNPVTIGSLNSELLTGTITGTIPSNTTIGTGYLLRITTSNPQFTGSSFSTALTINSTPFAPIVADLTVCQNSSPASLTATADANNTLLWYGTNASGGTSSTTANIYATTNVGATTYYVSQSNNTTGCESPRAPLQVTVTVQPVLPAVSPVSFCQNTTATPLVATPDANHTLIWYGTSSTGGTPSFNAPVPQTSTIGNTSYYVSQSNDITGCESARAAVVVGIVSQPAQPVASNVAYCINAVTTALTATALTGYTLQWYGTNSTGGVASLTAPTPSSLSAGQTIYYVSQKSNTSQCESTRKAITVTINSLPATPTVSSVTYCQNATSTALTATALANHTLLWYGTNAAGGTGSLSAPIPVTTTSGSIAYYVSQRSNTTNCESSRASIAVIVNASPAAPGITNAVYCQGASATALTATALSAHTLLWYGTSAAGGTSSLSAPVPLTSTAGITNYYVSQRNNSTLCESARSALAVTINELPAEPIALPASICKNSTAEPLSATALSGHTLLWYSSNSPGGTGSATTPIPDVTQSGVFLYYVSQRNLSTNCEGPRATLSLEVKDLPELPLVTNINFCLGQEATQLTGTALAQHSLIWYGTDAVGGTGSADAPIPSTVISGITNYYLTQYDSISHCESERTSIAVNIVALEKPSITAEGLGSGDVTLYSSVDTGNQWYRNALAIEGATESSYKISLQGLYQVQIIADGCSSELSDGQNIMVTGIDPLLKNSARAYPVPVKDILQIELSGLKSGETSEIQLTDMFGKSVDQKVITGPRGTLVVSTLASGVYILSVSNHLYRQIIRIIKE
jgi:hypothetical protein